MRLMAFPISRFWLKVLPSMYFDLNVIHLFLLLHNVNISARILNTSAAKDTRVSLTPYIH